MSSYDFLVVGSGIYGATFARLCTDFGKRVLVVEQRDRIGGNCADEVIEGIPVGLYGPHFFHCPDKATWNFVNRFSDFNDVRAHPRVVYGDRIFSFPINLLTLHQLWGVTTPEEARRRLEIERIPCDRPKNFEEYVLSTVGREIYEVFFYGYTTKQWGRSPRELPATIAKRIPIRTTFDENYFPDSHIFQGIPTKGYTPMLEAMLDGVEVRLDVDYVANRRSLSQCAPRTLYTGPLDRLYGYSIGALEYRSLKFKHEVVDGDHQGNTVMNYTASDVPHTRITEWKHKYKMVSPKSVITYEYPAEYAETRDPYYPINDEKNNTIHQTYLQMAESDGLIVGGRNADYRYYDMNMAIRAAGRAAEEACGVKRGTFLSDVGFAQTDRQ